jgi:uncharacterized protein (TIGR02996 family)
MSEDDFVRAVLADPKDNAQLLVYSDWLEEQADPNSMAKAEFLRLTVAPPDADAGKAKARAGRLQALAASLDVNWLAAVSRLRIENCRRPPKAKKKVRTKPSKVFQFLCPLKWEDLRETDDRAVRFCDSCQEHVHYCDTITAARNHALERHCVALDLGIIRREGDLRHPLEGVMFGRISTAALDRESELFKPDPVSAERERRKREAHKQP